MCEMRKKTIFNIDIELKTRVSSDLVTLLASMSLPVCVYVCNMLFVCSVHCNLFTFEKKIKML